MRVISIVEQVQCFVGVCCIKGEIRVPVRKDDMKIGDRVKLIRIPPDIRNDEELQTRALFEKCLGQTFTIAGFKTLEGLPDRLIQLDVGQVLGKASYLETIWVEPIYVQLEISK